MAVMEASCAAAMSAWKVLPPVPTMSDPMSSVGMLERDPPTHPVGVTDRPYDRRHDQARAGPTGG